MKKLVLVVVVVALSLTVVGSVFAAAKSATGQAQRNTGCGLGTMLFKGQADNSTLLQTFQMTTNHSISPQSFSITTGTFDCEQPAQFVKKERATEFVYANMDNLAVDVAKGSGETLDTLAELMEVPAAERASFFAKLQANFVTIFPSENVVLAEVMDNIIIVTAN